MLPSLHSEKVIRWGRDSDIQRYRCKDCRKTFNSLTGSPLARLHHHEKWSDYLRCMQESLTLRESAKRTGINRQLHLNGVIASWRLPPQII